MNKIDGLSRRMADAEENTTSSGRQSPAHSSLPFLMKSLSHKVWSLIRPRRPILPALVFALLLIGVINESSVGATEKWHDLSTQSANTMRKRVFAYTVRFADRFLLKPMNPQILLDEGLEAIEIGVENSSENALPRCFVSLYLTTAVQVGSDLGSEVSADLLDTDRHFFLKLRDKGVDPRELMSRRDSEYLLERQSSYFRQAGFTTADFVEGKRGARTSAAIQEHVADLLPEIRYIRIRGCMPSSMISRGAEIDVALRRNGSPDYSKIARQWRDEHFVKFRIPRVLLLDLAPALVSLEKEILRLIDVRNQTRRSMKPKIEK